MTYTYGRLIAYDAEMSASTSRDSEAGAGWGDHEPGTYTGLMPERVKNLSWLSPVNLWRSRNGVVASLFGDPTGAERDRWVKRRREEGVTSPGLLIERDDPDSYSFMAVGDTGEGDGPQYAVVPGFLKAGEGTRFGVIISDVMYPAGSVNEYNSKFFRPYQEYRAPLYAVPGNHDWYDGINGFMRVFCSALPLPPGPRPALFSAGRLRQLLWKRGETADEQRLAEAMSLRSRPEQQVSQPGPYWAMDSGPLRIIGIDTGLLGTIDKEQGAWLRQVSQGPRPKILITGSPIYTENEYRPCSIEGGGTVDEVVRDPACNYLAAIGGDTHNYQRYPVRVGDRTIEYIVSGGGGAFMSATHIIPRVDVAGVSEADFRCYPLRGDSLAFYSKLYGDRLHLRRLFHLTPEEATAVVADRIGVNPARASHDVQPTWRMKRVAGLLGVPRKPDAKPRFHLPLGKAYRKYISPTWASFTPPFFKNFLRLDVSPDFLRIRSFGATGYREQEIDPPVEDEIVIRLSL